MWARATSLKSARPDDELDLFRSRLALRHADAGDFRNGVHAARHQAGGGGRRQAKRRERGAPALIGGRTGQRRRADGIAGGEYPRNVGLEALIDLNMAAGADGELQQVESDAFQIGDPAECGEHDIGVQGFAAASSCTSTCENPSKRAPATSAPPRYSPPMAWKARKESLAQRGVEKPQRLRRLVEQRDGAAQRCENGGVLAGDHAAAEHHHGARYVGQTQNGIAVENVLMIHVDAGHMPRPRPGGEKDARRAHHAPRAVQALHLDAIGDPKRPPRPRISSTPLRLQAAPADSDLERR